MYKLEGRWNEYLDAGAHWCTDLHMLMHALEGSSRVALNEYLVGSACRHRAERISKIPAFINCSGTHAWILVAGRIVSVL